MTKYDADWVRAEEERRKWMAEHSLYRDDDEHASCGVGLVVTVDGKPRRQVVEADAPSHRIRVITDAGGLYLFDGLDAGTYCVEIDETTLGRRAK